VGWLASNSSSSSNSNSSEMGLSIRQGDYDY